MNDVSKGFDLQLFGGGGGGHTEVVEKPVYQQSAPSASPVQTESETDSERQEKRKNIAKAKGRAATNTGAGLTMGTAAAALENIRSYFTDEKKKTLG